MALVFEKQRIVLRFEDTVLRTGPYAGDGSEEINICVFGGDLILIRLSRLEQTSVFADACAGIVKPIRGGVYFLGKNWDALSPDYANAFRGRIGRVFSEGSWINHLSMLENIMLPQRYHTGRSVSHIREEAGGLAERFGLPGTPLGLPDSFTAADLQRAGCIRAFLGRPSLILLEEPTTGVVTEMISPLIQAIREARNRGAAVIWLTRDNSIWNDLSIPSTGRHRLVGRKLIEVTM
jgi:phospholipid/cholesterol/gamma-HCH transport system ATP-binding protein